MHKNEDPYTQIPKTLNPKLLFGKTEAKLPEHYEVCLLNGSKPIGIEAVSNLQSDEEIKKSELLFESSSDDKYDILNAEYDETKSKFKVNVDNEVESIYNIESLEPRKSIESTEFNISMQNTDKEKSKADEKQFKEMEINNDEVFHSNENYTNDQSKLEHDDQLTSKIQKNIVVIQNLKDKKRNNIKNPKKTFIVENTNINTNLFDEDENFTNNNSPNTEDFTEITRKNYINNQEEGINKQIKYKKPIINNKAINENNQQEESTDITIEKLQIEEIYEKTKENKKRIKKFSCKITYDFKPDFSSYLKFPYEPDLFQIQSFYFLENRNSIFVSAHTSSGKTSILHYCIHLAQKNKTRVIYTAPIKALSNQKYNELKEYKPGLITGDVSINKESNVLIVTTEILRNLLYSRSAILNNLEFVVFDEVHYVSDKERGVVWEECIIMMPSFVTIAMLSACINNDCEFAEWVGRIRDSQIYVIRTEKRAVPLEYFICKDEEIMNINAQGKQEINKVDNKESKKSVQKNIAGNYKKNNIPFLAKYIISKNLYPSIFFCFSKRKCHEYARQIIKQYLNDMERKEVLTIIKKSLEVLSHINRTLPQVEEVVKYLSNGIAIHHSGLLPILKELTEIIFSKGLTKILIATETVSIGVNFPAKSVVFLDFKKTSSDVLRLVYPQEFMQMSGRAGRRGKDKKGFVIINEQKNINKTDVFNLINGTSNISSRFKLSFSMILRMLRIKIKVEDLIKKSFGEDDAQKKAFNQKQKIDRLERELINLYKENNNPVFYANNSKPKYNDFKNITNITSKTYVNGKNEYEMHKNHRKDDKDTNKGKNNTVKEDNEYEQIYQTNVHNCKICNDIYGFTERMSFYITGIRKHFLSYFNSDTFQNEINSISFILKNGTFFIPKEIKDNVISGFGRSDDFRLYKSEYLHSCMKKSYLNHLNIDLNEQKELDSINNSLTDYHNSFNEKMSYFDKKIPIIPEKKLKNQMNNREENHFDLTKFLCDNIIEFWNFQINQKECNIRIDDILFVIKDNKLIFDFYETNYKDVIESLELKNKFEKIKNFTCLRCPHFKEHYNEHLKFYLIENQIKEIKNMLRDYDFSLVDDYYNKIKFLRNNEFIDENNNLLLKGRISCEIKTIDEIFVTEAVLSNVFKHLNPEDIMALISGFINFEINDECNNLILDVINTVLNEIKNNNDNKEIKTDQLCRNELIKINNNIDKQTCKNFESLLPEKMLHVEIKNHELNKNVLQENENKKNKDDFLGINKTVKELQKNSYGENTIKLKSLLFNFSLSSVTISSYTFKYGNAYVNAIKDWCLGKKLSEIVINYRVAEGTLVKTIMRLEEFCKEMKNICNFINDLELLEKIEECSNLLKRDIVNCTSLYFDE